MGQAAAQFDYPADDVALLRPLSPLAVAIFSDRAYLRTEMAEHAAAAGLVSAAEEASTGGVDHRGESDTACYYLAKHHYSCTVE